MKWGHTDGRTDKKFNSLLRYGTAQNTEFYTGKFGVCRNITSKFRTNVIFKTFVKENNNAKNTFRYVHDLLLYHTSSV
jgi:hypothetical protein